jgi:hypothetical protein
MAAQWLAERRAELEEPPQARLRFDAIGVRVSPGGRLLSLDHLEDAF